LKKVTIRSLVSEFVYGWLIRLSKPDSFTWFECGRGSYNLLFVSSKRFAHIYR